MRNVASVEYEFFSNNFSRRVSEFTLDYPDLAVCDELTERMSSLSSESQYLMIPCVLLDISSMDAAENFVQDYLIRMLAAVSRVGYSMEVS